MYAMSINGRVRGIKHLHNLVERPQDTSLPIRRVRAMPNIGSNQGSGNEII